MTTFLLHSHFGRSLEHCLKAVDAKQTELQLYCQPQVCLSTGNVVGYETLLRWFNPDHGYVQPENCLRIAEIYELGGQLLKWTIKKTIEYISLTKNRYHFAVNVCPTQLTHDLAEFILKAVKDQDIQPQRLMIELTEHRKASNIKQLSATIAWLRKNGIRIALDDFGSGHSTFESVVSFDLDLIKMDKSFVEGISHSDEKRMVLESTLSLLETLNIPILCEGIETQTDVKIIKKMGVHYGQGYYYGKPIHFDVLHDQPASNVIYLKNFAHLRSYR